MKSLLIYSGLLVLFLHAASAQNVTFEGATEAPRAEVPDVRPLPPPIRTGGMPLMDALSRRQTTRSYKPGPISEQQLSDALWAACGITRKDGRRTIPTAQNWQDILVYALDADGAWLYDPAKNELQLVETGDHRPITATQFFVKDAAVTLVYVSDTTKLVNLSEPTLTVIASFHAGEMAQNVSLYCASAGLGDVVRIHFAEPPLRELLGLPETHRIIMAHTLGVSNE